MVYDGITRRQVVELASATVEPAISIFVPTARAGTDVMQGRIRLKNLLTEAENLLVERGMRRTLAIDLLKPATRLDNDPDFWNDRLDAVAFFIGSDRFDVFHLPFPAPEFLMVGNRFYVRPLTPVLSTCLGWYVLSIDKGDVRLVHSGMRGASEVNVPEMPESLDAFVSLEHAEKRLQYHSAGPAGRAGSIIAHGTGDKGVDNKDRIHRFSLAITHAVEEHLGASTEPIVIAGTEEIQDSFRAVTKLPHVLKKGIERSPKMLDPLGLRFESWPIVQEHADESRKAAIAHYVEMAGTGLTSQQIEEILPAAISGRVDVLLSPESSVLWGKFDPQTASTTVTGGADELINEAAIATLQNSGVVYNVSADELVLEGPVGAIYRY